MRNRKRSGIILAIVICISALLIPSAFSRELTGRVFNITGNPIPNFEITVESNRVVARTRSNKEGEFEFYVGTGNYKVYASSLFVELPYEDSLYILDNCMSYFRAYERSPILFDDKKTTEIEVYLIESGSACGIATTENGFEFATLATYSHGNYHSGIEYEKLYFEAKSKEGFYAVIQFGYRNVKKDVETYGTNVNYQESRDLIMGNKNTVLTLGGNTFYAMEFKVNRKKKNVRAKNVTWVKNGARKTYSEINISLRNATVSAKN